MKRLVQLAAFAVFAALGGATSALTPEQCEYFETNGRTTICHATRSPRHPYVLLDVNSQACIGHSDHPADFVAPHGSCAGGACLPVNSPCDETLPCCEGLACVNGACAEVPQEDLFDPGNMSHAR